MSVNNPSHIKRKMSYISTALFRLLLTTIVLSLLNVLIYLIVFSTQGKLNEELKSLLTSTLLILPILPTVLFVVGSIANIVYLYKKQIKIKNLLTPLVLSGVDTLCIDKASGLTSGKLLVKKVIPLKAIGEDYIAQAVSNVLCATNNQSFIATALKREFDLELTSGVIDTFSLNDNFCIGASFKGGKTFVVGDPNHLPLINQQGIVKRCEEYFKNGNYVVALGESKDLVNDGKFNGALEAIALIVIKSCVRDNAKETFKWLQDNGVEIKVITSDDAISSSLLATEAGVNNADKYISLKGLNFGKIPQIIDNYSVFGDINQEQKLFLIKSLQEKGKTVATISSEENDASILRQSHCAISFSDGDGKGLNNSQTIIGNSSFSGIKEAFAISDNFNHAIRKMMSLFLINSFFTFAISMLFVFASIFEKDLVPAFPYSINNVLLFEIILSICSPLIFLFDKNNDRGSDKLSVSDILKRAIPSSLVLIVSTCMMFVIFLLQQKSLVSWGVYSINTFITMSVISISVLGLVILLSFYSPFTKYRKIAFICVSAFTAIVLLVCGLISYLISNYEPILGLYFPSMSGPAYLITAIIVVVFSALYLYVHRLIEIRKGEGLDNEN